MIPLGIHRNLPAEQYHADPAISASGLCYMMETSPFHLRHRLDHGGKSTPAMEFGSVFHAWVLEPEIAQSTFHLRPDEIDGERWHGAKKACKAWLAEHSDKPIVTSDDIADIKGMSEALRQNTKFMEIFEGGESEVSFFGVIDGIRVKARLDRFHPGMGRVIDLKKTRSANPEEFFRSAYSLRYHCRAAWYVIVLALFGEKVENFHFAAIEKDAPHANTIYTLERGNNLLDYGAEQIMKALRLYKQCLANNVWPSYPADSLKPPAWAMREIEAAN